MEKTNRLPASRGESNLWGVRPEQILPSLRGLEVRKYPAAGEVFFLDFSFYRTFQELACLLRIWHSVGLGSTLAQSVEKV